GRRPSPGGRAAGRSARRGVSPPPDSPSPAWRLLPSAPGPTVSSPAAARVPRQSRPRRCRIPVPRSGFAGSCSSLPHGLTAPGYLRSPVTSVRSQIATRFGRVLAAGSSSSGSGNALLLGWRRGSRLPLFKMGNAPEDCPDRGFFSHRGVDHEVKLVPVRPLHAEILL